MQVEHKETIIVTAVINGIEVEKVAGIAGLEVWAPVNQDMDMILYFTKDCKVIKTLDISLDDETSEFIFADIV